MILATTATILGGIMMNERGSVYYVDVEIDVTRDGTRSIKFTKINVYVQHYCGPVAVCAEKIDVPDMTDWELLDISARVLAEAIAAVRRLRDRKAA